MRPWFSVDDAEAATSTGSTNPSLPLTQSSIFASNSLRFCEWIIINKLLSHSCVIIGPSSLVLNNAILSFSQKKKKKFNAILSLKNNAILSLTDRPWEQFTMPLCSKISFVWTMFWVLGRQAQPALVFSSKIYWKSSFKSELC